MSDFLGYLRHLKKNPLFLRRRTHRQSYFRGKGGFTSVSLFEEGGGVFDR